MEWNEVDFLLLKASVLNQSWNFITLGGCYFS